MTINDNIKSQQMPLFSLMRHLKLLNSNNTRLIQSFRPDTQSRDYSLATHKLSIVPKILYYQVQSRFLLRRRSVAFGRIYFASDKKDNKMVDPRRVASYEDVLKIIHQPEKVLIDVRSPDEINTTGKIPSSINIPLNSVQDVLVSMSEEEFRKQFQRNKPMTTDELVFYCHSGKRSSEALDIALKLGYSNSKTYLGSWNEWSRTQK